MEHTPGPWVQDGIDLIGSNGKKVVFSGGGLSFGSVTSYPDAAANARLATAAPELLAALERLVAPYKDLSDDALGGAMVNARDAIAKAKSA